MKRAIRAVLALLVLVTALPPEPAWARGRGFHHHRHRTVFVGGTFFVGPAWYGYHPPPYYYGPTYEATNAQPSVYVEKFEGTPSAESGEIFCPQAGEYYPDIQQCPGGWQRVIRPTEPPAQGG